VRHYRVPSIYAESTGAGTVRPEDLRLYVRGVRNVMKYLGMLAGETERDEVRFFFQTDDPSYDFDTALNARQSGLLVVETELLAEVQPGDRLGRVLNLRGEVVEEIRADRPGRVLGLRAFSRIFAGDLAFIIVGETFTQGVAA
jgi:predicted deacylase